MDNNELCVVRLSEKLNTELAGDRLISPTLNLPTQHLIAEYTQEYSEILRLLNY